MDPNLRHRLLNEFNLLGCKPRVDLPLGPYTSYGVGGPASIVLFPESMLQFQQVMRLLNEYRVTPLILGGGSNVLVSSRGIDGVVIFTTSLDTIVLRGTILRCSAGALSKEVARKAQEAGLSGVEFLGGLPGTVGGAAYMNARAFGQEMSQVLISAMILDDSGEIRRISLEPQQFSYKRSPFMDQGNTIVALELALTPDDPQAIQERMDEQIAHRQKNGEHLHRSCGCAFKNPYHAGKSAGRIIDELGLKGHRIGGAWVHHGHANFIVHDGEATPEDLRSLMEYVRNEVLKNTGIELEYEVIFLGDWD